MLLVVGSALAFAAATALLATKTASAHSPATNAGAAAFFGIPALLFLAASVRLMRRKPDARPSLFYPVVWYSLCAFFAVAAIGGCGLLLRLPSPNPIDIAMGFLSSLALALLCYIAGQEAVRKGRRAEQPDAGRFDRDADRARALSTRPASRDGSPTWPPPP